MIANKAEQKSVISIKQKLSNQIYYTEIVKLLEKNMFSKNIAVITYAWPCNYVSVFKDPYNR